MYSEIDSLLSTMLQTNKLKYFLTIVGLIIVSFGLHYLLSYTPQELFIKQQSIVINQSQIPLTGENSEFYFTLFSDSFMQIPKNNTCSTFSKDDFTTWCDPDSRVTTYP